MKLFPDLTATPVNRTLDEFLNLLDANPAVCHSPLMLEAMKWLNSYNDLLDRVEQLEQEASHDEDKITQLTLAVEGLEAELEKPKDKPHYKIYDFKEP